MPMEMPIHPPERDLPRFTLAQEELPEVRKWMVNGKYYLVLKVEMVGKHNNKVVGADNSGDEGKLEGRFQVLSIKPLTDKPVDAKSLEREDFERVIAKARGTRV